MLDQSYCTDMADLGKDLAHHERPIFYNSTL